MPKKISTRGRKREARRWNREAIVRYAGVYLPSERVRAWFQQWEQLRNRDPSLAAAVNEVMDDDLRKTTFLSIEEGYARFRRRADRAQRERRRAEKRARRELDGSVKDRPGDPR